ncbi:MAG: hypothetical protein AAF984_11220 [Verrucomicrobiota bacterium]
MPDVPTFIRRNAAKITPLVVEDLMRKLPLMKVEFAQINAPKFPHLVDQLEFLVDVVEDFGDGEANDLPYFAVAEAAFAIIFAHKMFDLIPDPESNKKYDDDSDIVRTVLMQYEVQFEEYAKRTKHDWSKITSEP